jgi:spermidine synthase
MSCAASARDVHFIDFGEAHIVQDWRRPGGWLLTIDGVAQSYVDLADPEHLEFPYMRRVADVIDSAAPAGHPLRVLHLGGGAYTLPRYVAAVRPGSPQVVIERDGALAAVVERELPLPAGAGIEIRIGDARSAVESAVPAAYDLVLADVYQGARMAASVATTEFAAAAHEALAPGGTYILNVTDLPPLAFTRRQVATTRSAFPDVCALAEVGLVRGRRYGNVVLAGRRPPGRLPVERITRRSDAMVLHGPELNDFAAGARPLTDADIAV